MRNKLFLVGIFAGVAASIPLLYQRNPEAFQAFVRTVFDGRPVETAAVAPAEAETETAAPPAARDLPLGRKVRVEADRRGHFAADFRLNGTPVEGMIDTGATYVAINSSTARRIGISLAQADYKYKVNTANGITRAATATIDDLQIGRIHVGDVQAVVLEDSALGNTLIGMSFLKRLSKYQVENGSLLLEQ
jgi:aspartyl protease family protein